MTPEIEALRNTLKKASLEHLRRNPIQDEDERRGRIWQFAEKWVNASAMAKAHFVNEVHSAWKTQVLAVPS